MMKNSSSLAALPARDAQSVADEFNEYAYVVSHDLGAPVRAMVEFSKLLADEYPDALDDEGKLYLSFIVENGKKMQEMMEGLLYYSRLNTMAMPLVTVSAERIVQDALVVLDAKIKATAAVIEYDNLPQVKADIDQFLQVIINLIDNALTFNAKESPPHIRLSAMQKEGFWQFSIADNGIGIKPQFHDKIFRLFGRLHSDDAYPGVGTGLTLARKIIRRHGGELWCDATTPNGSIFHFTLPA